MTYCSKYITKIGICQVVIGGVLALVGASLPLITQGLTVVVSQDVEIVIDIDRVVTEAKEEMQRRIDALTDIEDITDKVLDAVSRDIERNLREREAKGEISFSDSERQGVINATIKQIKPKVLEIVSLVCHQVIGIFQGEIKQALQECLAQVRPLLEKVKVDVSKIATVVATKETLMVVKEQIIKDLDDKITELKNGLKKGGEIDTLIKETEKRLADAWFGKRKLRRMLKHAQNIKNRSIDELDALRVLVSGINRNQLTEKDAETYFKRIADNLRGIIYSLKSYLAEGGSYIDADVGMLMEEKLEELETTLFGREASEGKEKIVGLEEQIENKDYLKIIKLLQDIERLNKEAKDVIKLKPGLTPPQQKIIDDKRKKVEELKKEYEELRSRSLNKGAVLDIYQTATMMALAQEGDSEDFDRQNKKLDEEIAELIRLIEAGKKRQAAIAPSTKKEFIYIWSGKAPEGANLKDLRALAKNKSIILTEFTFDQCGFKGVVEIELSDGKTDFRYRYLCKSGFFGKVREIVVSQPLQEIIKNKIKNKAVIFDVSENDGLKTSEMQRLRGLLPNRGLSTDNSQLTKDEQMIKILRRLYEVDADRPLYFPEMNKDYFLKFIQGDSLGWRREEALREFNAIYCQ